MAFYPQPKVSADRKSRVDLALEKKKADETQWRTVCALVDARDERTCRCCDKRTNPDMTGLLRGHRHHIVYRSAGGKDDTANVVTLCPKCHDDEHIKRTLQIEGNADVALLFFRKDEAGAWFVSREEIAVRQVRKD